MKDKPMAERKANTRKKTEHARKSGKVQWHSAWKYALAVVSVLLVVIVGLVYLFKPHTFRMAYRKVEKIIFTNPQSSSVEFPKNEVVGIDISYYQEDIDWQNLCFRIHPLSKTLTKDTAAPRRRVDFVIAKASEGVTIKDPKYDRNRKGAKSANIPFGAYHFFSVSSDPLLQAKHFIQVAKLEKGNLLPVLDVEYKGRLSKKELRRRVLLWLEAVEKHYGRKPIIYTYANFHDDVFDTEEFKGYHFWMAHYGVDEPRHDCRMWQFTEDGVVCGINGYVDVDVFFGNRERFQEMLIQ